MKNSVKNSINITVAKDGSLRAQHASMHKLRITLYILIYVSYNEYDCISVHKMICDESFLVR